MERAEIIIPAFLQCDQRSPLLWGEEMQFGQSNMPGIRTRCYEGQCGIKMPNCLNCAVSKFWKVRHFTEMPRLERKMRGISLNCLPHLCFQFLVSILFSSICCRSKVFWGGSNHEIQHTDFSSHRVRFVHKTHIEAFQSTEICSQNPHRGISKQ